MDKTNDVLGYAVAGGIGKNQKKPDPSTYGGNDISSPLVLLACMQG
jgi:hypothetical protein